MLQFMTLYGLAVSFYDIISKFRSNRAYILIFIKIAIWRDLVCGVDLGHFWGTSLGYLSLGWGRGWNIGVVSFILVVLLSDPQRNSKFNFPWFHDRCLAARPSVKKNFLRLISAIFYGDRNLKNIEKKGCKNPPFEHVCSKPSACFDQE